MSRLANGFKTVPVADWLHLFDHWPLTHSEQLHIQKYWQILARARPRAYKMLLKRHHGRTMEEEKLLKAYQRVERAHRRTCWLEAARKRATHTQAQWLKLKAEVKGRCPRCGLLTDQLEKDHILPTMFGGSDGTENLQPLCKSCNSGKAFELINWLKFRRVMGWRDIPPEQVPRRFRVGPVLSPHPPA